MKPEYLEKIGGYNPRTSGACQASYGTETMPCDVCEREVPFRIGMEKDYPDNPDTFICSQCLEEYSRHMGWFTCGKEMPVIYSFTWKLEEEEEEKMKKLTLLKFINIIARSLITADLAVGFTIVGIFIYPETPLIAIPVVFVSTFLTLVAVGTVEVITGRKQ